MSIFREWICPFVRTLFFAALAKGFLLYLAIGHGIRVDVWIAQTLGLIEAKVTQAPDWVGWTLVGVVGILGSSAWEVVKKKRQRQRELPEANETPSANIALSQTSAAPPFDVIYRYVEGFAEICVRNLSSEKTLDEVVVAIPNVSETLDIYEPQNVFIQLTPRDHGSFIHPKGQKYYRFSRVIDLNGDRAIEIWSGMAGVLTTSGPQCAVKFRVSARDTRERLYYIAVTIDSEGGLALGRYKRRKKAKSISTQTADFLNEIASLRTLETVLRNAPICDQREFDDWQTEVNATRKAVVRAIEKNISSAEAETYKTVGNLMYFSTGGFNEHHKLLRSILTRDIDYLQDLIIHYCRTKS